VPEEAQKVLTKGLQFYCFSPNNRRKMADGKAFYYEFGNYRLSPGERQLFHGERPIALTPKAFELCWRWSKKTINW
jgi:DNA-binding response OmpR family regulator